MEVLKSAMNFVYTDELIHSLLYGLDESDSLDSPYNIFYTFILIIYARTMYELFSLRSNPRFAIYDSLSVG